MTDPPRTHFVEINDIAHTTHAINVNYIVVMIQDASETYRVLLSGVAEPIHVDKANMDKISKVISRLVRKSARHKKAGQILTAFNASAYYCSPGIMPTTRERNKKPTWQNRYFATSVYYLTSPLVSPDCPLTCHPTNSTMFASHRLIVTEPTSSLYHLYTNRTVSDTHNL